MPIITYTEYWPAKLLGSEERIACMEHELKLYGPEEKNLKKWNIEYLAICGQWAGNVGRIMAVMKVPSQHLNDWIMDYAKRNTIYFQKLEGFDSEYEIWASNEEMDDIFKDEPFYKNIQNMRQKLLEKYSKPE